MWIWSFRGSQWELLVLPVIVLSNKVIIIIIIIIITTSGKCSSTTEGRMKNILEKG